MRSIPLEELIRLPERQALDRFFDGRNYLVLRWVMALAAPVAVLGTIALLTDGRPGRGLAWAVVAIGVVALFVSRSGRFFAEHARQLLLLFLLTLFVAAVVTFRDPAPGYAIAGFAFPAGLALFRLRPLESLAAMGLSAGTAVWFALQSGMPSGDGARVGTILSVVVWVLVAAAVGQKMTRRRATAFFESWRHARAQENERSRMRTELDDARTIQLSMLPAAPPELDWLELSSISLPAAEVGGDYFDYFELPGRRLAVVIGDVAGHGVASGIVLSGLRSGLYLLRSELARPIEVLTRLNDMVRDTAPARMFVTLQIALFDPATGHLTVASAGHPPAWKIGASGEKRALGEGGLPLGTRLAASFSEVEERLETGDLLLFYSDGLTEIRNLHGEDFGEERLVAAAARTAGGSTREVRDSILSRISGFKGDVAQEDDLTLIVARPLAPGAGS